MQYEKIYIANILDNIFAIYCLFQMKNNMSQTYSVINLQYLLLCIAYILDNIFAIYNIESANILDNIFAI